MILNLKTLFNLFHYKLFSFINTKKTYEKSHTRSILITKNNLINQFKQKTNIGGVLNTSFNLHGFPNVSSHDDAFITFKKSNLKYLIIENFLIKKNI